MTQALAHIQSTPTFAVSERKRLQVKVRSTLSELKTIVTPQRVKTEESFKTEAAPQSWAVNITVIQGKIQNKVARAALGSVQFMMNKLQHGARFGAIGIDTPLLNSIGGMTYFTAHDENGVPRGGSYPWMALQDMFSSSDRLTRSEKCAHIRARLAQLPGNVNFSFSASADMKDLDVMAEGFTKSGFTHATRKTYAYRGSNDGKDVLSQMKSDARNKVNSAIRDLEIVSMSVDEYFDFYKKNLAASGKDSFFNLNIDHLLAAEAMKSNDIQIIATRKKATEAEPGPFPIEAAIILTSGADGYMKLLRITYVRETPELGFVPHKHATKFLVYEAMRRAVQNGLVLDTDGYTPGGDTLYSRFGVFQLETRHYFDRRTVQTLVNKIVPAIKRRIEGLTGAIRLRLNDLLNQPLFTQNVFQSAYSITL